MLSYTADPLSDEALLMKPTSLELRRTRRELLARLAARLPGERRFLWRRCHLLLPSGRANTGNVSEHFLPGHGSLSSCTGVADRQFAAAFNAATDDGRQTMLHATVLVYPVTTYLPAIPVDGHLFDFDVEPARDARALSPADVREMFEDECRVLRAHAWGQQRLRKINVLSVPRLVTVHKHAAASSDEWWHVANGSDFAFVVDGNARGGLTLACRQPWPPLRWCGDLAALLDGMDWA
jgi:hypothetical protein